MTNAKSAALHYVENWKVSVIPLKENSKLPSGSWIWYQKRIPLSSEISNWNISNIGIVTGAVSELVVFDADTPEAVAYLEQKKKFANTYKIKTRRGLHYYFTVRNLPKDFGCRKFSKGGVLIDLKANGGYVVACPSRIAGHEYTAANDEIDWMESKERPFLELELAEIEEIGNELKKTEGGEKKKKEKGDEAFNFAKLKDIFTRKLYEPLKKCNKRQDFYLSLCGWLRREGLDKEAVNALVEELASLTGDEEKKQRLSCVESTYGKPIDEIKGYSGLKATLKTIGMEDALDSVKYEEKYFNKGRILYHISESGLVECGPYIEIVANVKVEDQTFVEIRHGDKTNIIDIKELKTIESFAGMPIVKETLFKKFLIREIDNCQAVKTLKKQTGWEDGVFYHPDIQNDLFWKLSWKKGFGSSSQIRREHCEFIKNALSDGKNLAFLYAFCFGSVLNRRLDGAPSALFISGPTAVGKTTLAKLGVNLFYSSENVSMTADTTRAGMEFVLRELADLPVLFDEATLKGFDLEHIVYKLYSGVTRVRGSKTFDVNVSGVSSNVIFTSESLEQSVFKGPGSARRLFGLTINDFEEDCYTGVSVHDVQQSIKLFGGGVEILKWLMGYDNIQECVKGAEQAINENELGSFHKVALPILTAIIVFERFFNEDFSGAYNHAIEILLEQKEDFSEKGNVVERFKEELGSYLVENTSHVISDEEGKRPISPILAKIDGNGDILIPTQVFQKFCNDHSFELKHLIKKLKKERVLIPGNDGMRTSARFPGFTHTVGVYRIRLNS